MARGRFSAKKRVDDQKAATGFKSKTLDLKGLDLFKIDAPDSLYVDVMAFEADHGNPFAAKGDMAMDRTYWVHRGLGPEGKDTFPCNAKNGMGKCVVCERINLLRRSTDPAAEEQIKELRPKQRQLFLIRDVKEDGDWKVWDISYHLFGKLLNSVINDLDEDEQDHEYFASPEGGYTLKISLNEKQFNGANFYEAFGIGFKKRKKDYTEAEVMALPCPDNMILKANQDELLAALNGEEYDPSQTSREEAPAETAQAAPEAPEQQDDCPFTNPPPEAQEPAPATEPAPEADSSDDDDWNW